MEAQTKSSLILLATFVLGMLAGVLGTGALQNRRIERIEGIRRPGGIAVHIMEGVIQPRDSAQRAAIRPHLVSFERRSRAEIEASRRAFVARMDTLRADLAPLLDADQRERLEQWRPMRPFRRGMFGPRPYRGRHPPSPPPDDWGGPGPP